MNITCKQSTAKLNVIDQLIDSPDTSTVHGELCCLTGMWNRKLMD